MLLAMGRHRSARAHLDRALEVEQRAWGGSHPDQAETLEMLGELAEAQGQAREARDLYESSLEKFEEYLGAEHPHAARVRDRLRQLEG